MIFQPIIDFVLFLIDIALSNMDIVSLELPANIFSVFDALFGALGYLFPIKKLLPILLIDTMLNSSRLVMAIVVRIKSFIPTMGN